MKSSIVSAQYDVIPMVLGSPKLRDERHRETEREGEGEEERGKQRERERVGPRSSKPPLTVSCRTPGLDVK